MTASEKIALPIRNTLILNFQIELFFLFCNQDNILSCFIVTFLFCTCTYIVQCMYLSINFKNNKLCKCSSITFILYIYINRYLSNLILYQYLKKISIKIKSVNLLNKRDHVLLPFLGMLYRLLI